MTSSLTSALLVKADKGAFKTPEEGLERVCGTRCAEVLEAQPLPTPGPAPFHLAALLRSSGSEDQLTDHTQPRT